MEFYIPESKITKYLLNNPSKSGFFLRHGYTLTEWTRLRDDILSMTAKYPAIFERDSEYGRKFAVRGGLAAPDGRWVRLSTIWMIEPSAPQRAKFLTAYPA